MTLRFAVRRCLGLEVIAKVDWRASKQRAADPVNPEPVVSSKLMKDPKAPKRPLTAYFAFLEDVRHNPELRKEVLADTPREKMLAIAQLAGQKWKAMSEEEKQVGAIH